MLKNTFFIILIISAMFLEGCFQKSLEYPDFQLTSVDKSPEEIMSKLWENSQKVSTLRGYASITLDVEGKKDSFDGAFLYLQPRQLRLDMYGFWGKLLMIGALDNDSVQVYLPTENWLVESSANSTKLKEWIGFDIDFNDLLLIFNGFSPYLGDVHITQVLEIHEDRYKLTVENLDCRVTFWVVPAYFFVDKAVIWDKKKSVETRFQLSGHIEYEGVFLAQKASIYREQFSQKLSIKYEELDVNPKLNSNDFDFSVPEGIERFSLID